VLGTMLVALGMVAVWFLIWLYTWLFQPA